jgi:hypothetical protein
MLGRSSQSTSKRSPGSTLGEFPRLARRRTASPVFGSPSQDYDRVDDDLHQPQSSLKRKATPHSAKDLRKSKRGAQLQDGFKQDHSPKNNLTARGKKASRKCLSTGNIPQASPSKVDFPDLAAIDRFINLGLTYLEISVSEIKRVAVESCGVQPLEVSSELLQPNERVDGEGNILDQKLQGWPCPK